MGGASVLYAPPESRRVVHRVRKRFLKAFIWAALFCAVFGIIHKGSVHFGLLSGWDDGWPIPPEYNPTECVNGEGWRKLGASGMRYPHLAETSFELPLDSDLLFLLSRGAKSAGRVEILTTSSESDQVTVDVTMHYRNQDALRVANVCLLTRKSNEHGVGIFTPNHRGYHDETPLYFSVVVHLPVGGTKPLVIDAFSTDLQNFSLELGNLQDAVKFNSLDLQTTNAEVTAGSLHADNAKITTGNGDIRGSFKTSTALSLKTFNANVKVDVALHNDDTPPTTLDISSFNGFVDTTLSQFSKLPSGGNFGSSLTTTNEYLTVTIPESPLGATVKLSGMTFNGHARLALPATYEGAYAMLTTPYSSLTLNLAENVEDPSGEGRHREVRESGHGFGKLEGRVRWVPGGDGAESSSVTLRTINKGVTLNL